MFREILTKTTLKVHLTTATMAKINKTIDSSCWQGCGVRETLIRYWQGFLQTFTDTMQIPVLVPQEATSKI